MLIIPISAVVRGARPIVFIKRFAGTGLIRACIVQCERGRPHGRDAGERAAKQNR